VTEEPNQTYEVHDSREDAVAAMRALQAQGWVVYPETVPLQGQAGFYCILHDKGAQDLIKQTHSILWNMYDQELIPVVVDCQSDSHLFSFVMTHGKHDTFGYFKYPNEDVGFVCYCRGEDRGVSLVLRITDEEDSDLSEDAYEFLWLFEKEM
jgi:hypothetical protein